LEDGADREALKLEADGEHWFFFKLSSSE